MSSSNRPVINYTRNDIAYVLDSLVEADAIEDAFLDKVCKDLEHGFNYGNLYKEVREHIAAFLNESKEMR